MNSLQALIRSIHIVYNMDSVILFLQLKIMRSIAQNKNTHMKNLLMTLLLSLASLTGMAQVNVEKLKQEYKEEFEQVMKKSKIPGLSLSLVSKDSVVMELNLGYSDEKSTEVVNSQTLFGLGSVTKVFTGVAVMQLVEQDKVRLDNSLNEYLPQFHIKGEHSKEVTVRNVMTHHSGLPSDVIKGMFTQNPEHYTKVVDYMKEEYLAGKPNQIRAYSNPGYTLLGHMVDEVSGKSYPDYMKDEVLAKINMQQTGFNLRDQASASFNSKGEAKQDVLLRDIPAGGMDSNNEEMVKFLTSFLNKDENLLSRASYDQIFQEQYKDLPLNFGNRYGLGWTLTSRPHTGEIYTHTGTTMYFNSAVAVAPEVGLAAVVLTNAEKGGRAFGKMMSLIDKMAEDLGREAKQDEKIESFETDEVIDLPHEVTDQYVGIYATPGAILKIYKKKDKLYSTLQGLKVRLLPVENNVFIPKILLFKFIPLKLKENRFMFENIEGYNVMTQMEIGSGKELLALKMEPYEISNSWKDRLGKYKAVNKLEGEIDFFEDFELLERDGLLIMLFKQGEQKIEMALDIVDDSYAKVAGLGRYSGQSLQTKGDQLQFFGIQLQKLTK
ncbi:hypothetical protein MATR_12740 [Marivirga tractuosa]|nr:hypothetical protein MATR_12740 [Marivirga tractuosa]